MSWVCSGVGVAIGLGFLVVMAKLDEDVVAWFDLGEHLVPAAFVDETLGVCDGIAMGHIGMKYSLASRELICDSVETMFMAHQLDGLVLVPNCDKIVPGMVMAAVRMDVPAIVCSGGPMLAGSYGGDEVSLSKMFEAVGAYKAGMIDDAQWNTTPGTMLPVLIYNHPISNPIRKAWGVCAGLK